MDNRLLALRSDSYAAAIAFHRVASEYFMALRDRRPTDESADVVIALEEAATLYANTLDDLLDYLRAAEQTPATREELQRTVRIRDLLRHEMHLMRGPS